jgi:hypothetical protein
LDLSGLWDQLKEIFDREGGGILLILGGGLYLTFTGDFIVCLVLIGIGVLLEFKHARDRW